MDDSSQDEGDRGNADKHYQFVFSSAGNPRQDMKFCDCGEGAFSGVKNNESYSTLRAKLCQRNDGMSSANAVALKQSFDTGEHVNASLDEVERLLAKAMSTISVTDRERAMEDLHGIRSNSSASTATIAASVTAAAPYTGPISEATVLSVSSSMDGSNNDTDARLHEMESLLQRGGNEAYQLALSQHPEYVQDAKLRLSFLNTFQNAKKAVEKMLQFLEIKLHHFGKEALCRDITMDDLDEDTRACLEGGFYQYLGRDSADRRVVGTFPVLLKYNSLESVVKMEFYWWTSLFPMQDASNRDLVIVQYSTRRPDPKLTSTDINVIKAQHKQFCVTPVKLCAWHIVLESRQQNSIAFQVIKILSSKALNVRTTFHIGNQVEVQYELRRFGINTDPMTFPVSLNGDIDLDIHRRYLDYLGSKKGSKTRNTEGLPSSLAASPVMVGIMPTEKDILFGRGFNTQHHPGNITFRKILVKHYNAYTNADNADKIVLVDHLSSQMKSQLGVRFLKLVNNYEKDKPSSTKMWVEETDSKVIRSKFFQAFRNLRASYRRAAEQQQQQPPYHQSF